MIVTNDWNPNYYHTKSTPSQLRQQANNESVWIWLRDPHGFIKSKPESYILQGPTIILGLIFQSSNQGGSTVPWPYYLTTYKHVLVSIRVLFSVYHFYRTAKWLTQLVSGSISVPLYTQGTWGLKSVLSAHLQICKCGPWVYAHEQTILLSDKSLEVWSRYCGITKVLNHMPLWQATWGLAMPKHVSNLDWLDCF